MEGNSRTAPMRRLAGDNRNPRSTESWRLICCECSRGAAAQSDGCGRRGTELIGRRASSEPRGRGCSIVDVGEGLRPITGVTPALMGVLHRCEAATA
jgi:hypothetical protein